MHSDILEELKRCAYVWSRRNAHTQLTSNTGPAGCTAFYDAAADSSYWIAPWARRPAETVKRYRNHLFVGIITILRACVRIRPTMLVGSGQGALVLLAGQCHGFLAWVLWICFVEGNVGEGLLS